MVNPFFTFDNKKKIIGNRGNIHSDSKKKTKSAFIDLNNLVFRIAFVKKER